MGSGRKRPADRSETPTSERKKEGKTKKKKSKLKHNKESSSDTTSHKPSLETTATAEGQIMAQVLSTFSRLEQSRFEAFRRATFAGDAISKYVAQLLIQRKEHPNEQQQHRRKPILSELCAPGQAEEITIVVSTLAKAYAQRLVTAARRLQAEHDENKNNDSPTTLDANASTPPPPSQQQQATSHQQPIEAYYILQAHRERQAQGLDPGFFFQPPSSATNLCMSEDSNKAYEQLRLAALQAQEDYDKEQAASTAAAEAAGGGGKNDNNDDDSSDDSEDFAFMNEDTPTKT